jgi:hypothetical protein
MVANSHLHGDSLEAIIDQLQDELAADALLGYPGPPLVTALVRALEPEADSPMRLLLSAETERAALDNFLTATKLAAVIGNGLEVRTTTEEHSVAVTDGEQVIVPVGVPGGAAGLVDTEEEFVQAVAEAYEEAWADASAYEPDVPALDDLLSELVTTTSEEVAADFEAVLSATEAFGTRGDFVDVVTLALLLGARHDALLYDLSEWGEETGLASKATFSRKKSQLEDDGLIATESVPIDVGRPRLRLLLIDNELAEADPGEFVELARTRLQ